MKAIIGYIAKEIYQDKYKCLHVRLLKELVNIHNYNHFDTLTKLLISGEDHRFLHHTGFDIIAIIRAIKNRFFFNKIEGASTIEQQLVRVLTNDYQRTFKRKIQEILLATTLTSIAPKSAIAKIYLNVPYFGANMSGLQQTLEKMNIPWNSELSLETAAEIVSRIKYPQPNQDDGRRLLQIKKRKQHLISLYHKHLKRRIIKVYA